jgi:hypothetical protein
MADWATISSMATAGGTLVLAIATFSSVRSGQHAARIAERSLLAGLRPVLMPARPDDPPQQIEFGDDVRLIVEGGRPTVEAHDGGCYMVMGLRNVGAGLAVLDSWHVVAGRPRAIDDHAPLEDFRRLIRDTATTRAASARSAASFSGSARTASGAPASCDTGSSRAPIRGGGDG